MDVESCYVVLWSRTFGAVHLETAVEMAAANRRTFLDERENDYVVLEFVADEDAARERVRFYQDIREERARIRGP